MNQRIKKIRRELDLTQQEFSEKLGVSRANIGKYETGISEPSAAVFSLICREFNVNEEWLRNGTGEMFVVSPTDVLDALAEKYGLSHGDYVLIEKFVNLKAEKRAAVVDYVLQVAVAMQEEDVDSTIPVAVSKSLSVQQPSEPQTATDEEKMAAYKEYLDEKGKKRREAN